MQDFTMAGVPCWVRRAQAEARAKDDRYFADHPGDLFYIRRVVRGEWWPESEEHITHVIVARDDAPPFEALIPIFVPPGANQYECAASRVREVLAALDTLRDPAGEEQ